MIGLKRSGAVRWVAWDSLPGALAGLGLVLAACSSEGPPPASNVGGSAGSGGGGSGSAGVAGAPGGGSGGSAPLAGSPGKAGSGGGGQVLAVADCAPTEVGFTVAASIPGPGVAIDANVRLMRAMEGRGTALYILVDRALWVVEGGATSATAIATDIEGIVGTNSPAADGPLRVTDSHAYFPTTQGISRVELATGNVQVVYAGLVDGTSIGSNAPDFLEIEGDTVYFAVRELDQVFSVPAAGGEAQLLTEGTSVEGMAVRGGYIYLSAFTVPNLLRLPTTGGEPEQFGPNLTDQPSLSVLTSTETALYFVAGYGTDRLGSIAFAAPDSVMELGEVEGANLTVDGNRVYWGDYSLGYTNLDGSGCVTVVFGDFPYSVTEYAITSDYVFVSGSARSADEDILLRLPKN